MTGARNQVQAVEASHSVRALVVSKIQIHDLADGLVIMNGGSSRDTGVRLAVVVDDLTTSLFKGAQVGVGSL